MRSLSSGAHSRDPLASPRNDRDKNESLPPFPTAGFFFGVQKVLRPLRHAY
jgi:hypothetical protein